MREDTLEDFLERIEGKIDQINERLEDMPDFSRLNAALDRIDAANVLDAAEDAKVQASVDALAAHAENIATNAETGQPTPAPVPLPTPTDQPPAQA